MITTKSRFTSNESELVGIDMAESSQARAVLSGVGEVYLPSANKDSPASHSQVDALQQEFFVQHLPNETVPSSAEERYFLQGPRSRSSELLMTLHIVRDFVRGFRVLHFIGPCVTVFGSARFKEDHPFYSLARQIGSGLSRLGFTVMTGGGPGIMEAANRGAHESGGRSVGCNIRLPEEQEPNRYLDRHVTLNHFFVRKVLLIKYSYAFIGMPGGFGTMDEIFEALTLIQTRKIRQFPIVLFGKNYWKRLIQLLSRMVQAKTIDPADLKFLLITDSVEEAMQHIQRHAIEQFGLQRRKVSLRRSWLLRE